MSSNFVTDNPKSWPDEYEGTAQTVERLRVCRRDVRKYEVCSRIPARKPVDSMRPELELYSFSAAKEGTRALHRLFARDCDYVKHGSYFHQLRHRAPLRTRLARSLFVREGAVIQLWEFETGNTKFATVLHIRRWLLLLPLLLAALILSLSLSLCSPSGSPDFIAGMTATAGVTHKQVVSVDYCALDASVDSTWKADSLTRDFRLSLPATCKYAKGKEGGNPIISSPSIMVDLNHDGKYDSDTECVYNAPDKTGYGAFIRPGCEVNRIKLTQSVPAGTYSARTVWRSVLASDGKTPASSTSFDFNLTVE